MKFSLVLVLVLALALPVFGSDVLSDITHGVLSLSNTAKVDAVSHWSFKKGDFGGGAGVGLFAINAWGVPLFVEGTGVGYQTRHTVGLDLACPLSSSLFSPLIKDLDLGGFGGWNYQLNVEDQYTDVQWLGFDWGLSLIKRF